MRYCLLAIITFFCFNSTLSAQEKEFTYIQFDVTASFTGNQDYNDDPRFQDQERNWFVPDGLGSKLGYGVHYKKWIMLGIHSGLDWKWNEKLVNVPVYLNFGLSPKIVENTRLTLQLGYGKSFALGRGDLGGIYRKARLGITGDDRTVFIEIADFGYPIADYNSIGGISIGVSLITF